jgi:hypothetical protein
MASPVSMPEPLELLQRDLVWVHARWKLNSQLFRSGAKRVALLNAYGGALFASIQRILIDDIVIGLSRLLDPAATGSNANHTLETLLALLPAEGHEALRADMARDLSSLRDFCAPLRAHRNKRVAHRDLSVAARPSEHPLPDLSYNYLSDALDRVTAWVNRLQFTLCGSSMLYTEFSFIPGGDADALIYALKKTALFDEQHNPHEARELVSQSDYADA